MVPAMSFTIVGLGEALFDLLPGGPVLGGAPLNVAVHAHQLLAPAGGRGLLVSRVGRDALGDRLRAELASRGMSDAQVQSDPERPTGTVAVTLENGEPRYDIKKDVAWDRLAFTTAAADCDALCFGTLAQRQAGDAVLQVVESAKRALRLFDVNLRQDYWSAALLRRSLQRATMVKLNEEELPRVTAALGVDGLEGLRRDFHLEAAVLTRGPRGTQVATAEGLVDGEPARFPLQPGADSVGAGDACSAGLLAARVQGRSWAQALALANRLGAYVASVPGATPRFPADLLGVS